MLVTKGDTGLTFSKSDLIVSTKESLIFPVFDSKN
jgi:hypothetical protein